MISDGVAYTVADVMKGTLEYGTAAGLGIGCPAAGKTGTTEEQSDAWFVGYTPHVSTAVWVGNPDARVPLPGYGADLAAPIWQEYMSTAATEPCDDFPRAREPGRRSRASTATTRVSLRLRRPGGLRPRPTDHGRRRRRRPPTTPTTPTSRPGLRPRPLRARRRPGAAAVARRRRRRRRATRAAAAAAARRAAAPARPGELTRRGPARRVRADRRASRAARARRRAGERAGSGPRQRRRRRDQRPRRRHR